MSRDGKRPVTIEDLLRLKATERPAPAFWEQFDRELRAKQLSALVEKRPWWQRATAALTDWRRYRVPAGALAMLAVGYFSVRSWDSFSPAPMTERQSVAVAMPSNVAQPQVGVPSSASAPLVAEQVAAVAVDQIQQDLGKAGATQLAASVASVSQNAAPVPAKDEFESKLEQSFAAVEQTPSARYIAANLAVVQETEPLLARGLLATPAATISSETRAQTTRTAMVEPLTQVTPTSGARRARFQSAMVATADMSSRAGGEREARSLSDERLYDSIRRVNAKGASVLVKF